MTTINYIEKAIEDPRTGADVKYHEVTAYAVDLQNNTSTVTVTSYISKKMREMGKEPVGAPVTLSLNLAPPASENALTWFLGQLTQATPTDYVPLPENERYYGWFDPYTFSGGTVKSLTLASAETP